MTSPFSLPLWVGALNALWQLHGDVKSRALQVMKRREGRWGGGAFLLKWKTGSFCSWSKFLNLYPIGEGWACVFSSPQLYFSLHVHTWRATCCFSLTFFRFHHLVRDSTQQCRDVTRDFSNLGASAGPLRGRIISLRLFHAAPVFSCVALLIWTWCIARVQTIV